MKTKNTALGPRQLQRANAVIRYASQAEDTPGNLMRGHLRDSETIDLKRALDLLSTRANQNGIAWVRNELRRRGVLDTPF